MAQNRKTIESVWAAKGNLPDNAIVATADGKYPALDGSLITNVGAGDLLAANNLSELTATASVARTNLELGAADTVEFGGFVPPSGTTAEIDAVATAEVGQVMVDTDRNVQVRFTAPAVYKIIGAQGVSVVYLVNPNSGDDATGSGGGTPFKTIGAAFVKAIADDQSQSVIQRQAGTYSVSDATHPQTYTADTASASIFSVVFDAGCILSGSGAFINNTSGDLQINTIGGELGFNPQSNLTIYNGVAPTTGSKTLYIKLRILREVLSSNGNDIIIGTGGRIVVDAGSMIAPSALLFSTIPRMFQVTAGEMVIQNLEIDAGLSGFAEKGYAVKVSAGARAILNRCRCNNFSLAHQTATNSFVLLEDCLHSSTRAGDTAVKADVAATDLYVKGGNFSSGAVAANSNLITTFGSLTQSTPSALIWQP